jgi:RNA 2',3'-cyclic 3'-phosphodiesterase
VEDFKPDPTEGFTEHVFGPWHSRPPDPQLSLPGLDDPDASFPLDKIDRRGQLLPQYTLFFALQPDDEDAIRISDMAGRLAKKHGLTDRTLQADRLHVSLQSIGAFVGSVLAVVVEAAVAAARGVTNRAFEVVFDKVQSFPPSNAFVLAADTASTASIAKLRQSLAARLRRVSLRSDQSRTPHMTLLYDKRPVAVQTIQPVRWAANRFVLILSHVGLTHHQRIGTWVMPSQ